MEINSNILFVDAETSVLESIKRMLMDTEKQAFFASTTEDAIAIIESNNIDTLFVDITTGNLVELLEKVQASNPDIVKVVISDFSHLSIIINSIRKLNLHSFLLKPWKKQELLETLKSAEEYAKFLKMQTREKENLEQKNVIYQRIINFKDDVGEANKADINSLKTSMFLLASEYENVIKSSEAIDKELTLRSLYTASEIYTTAFPTFLEKFTIPELINSISLTNMDIKSLNDDFIFAKNLTLLREFITRIYKFLTSFMGTSALNLEISKYEENIVLNFNGNYNVDNKNALIIFLRYLTDSLKTMGATLSYNLDDNSALKFSLSL